MKRRIIMINEDLCNGCGICAEACHEDAIGIENGKAVLLRDDYCDGLGDCLPTCPTSAISFEEREALPFDKEAVEANMRKKGKVLSLSSENTCPTPSGESTLGHWPVQLNLVMSQAEFLQNADLLISADCCAYANSNFHSLAMKGKVTLIGCPKLDTAQYADKISEILEHNQISSVTVARMEVPCCGGLEFAVKEACQRHNMPYEVLTVGIKGELTL